MNAKKIREIFGLGYDESTPETLKNLIKEHELDIKNIRDSNGQTLLHKYIDPFNKDIVKWLIEQGVDINAQDKYGDTAAHLAVVLNKEEFFDFLFNGMQKVDTGLKSNSYDKKNHHSVAERADYLFNDDYSPYNKNDNLMVNKCIIDFYNDELKNKDFYDEKEKRFKKTYNSSEEDRNKIISNIVLNCDYIDYEKKINSVVSKYFKNYKIEIQSKDYDDDDDDDDKDKNKEIEYKVEIICSGNFNSIFIITINKDISFNKIYIDMIGAPCKNYKNINDVDNLKGTQIVRKIINIADELKIKIIGLEDQSEINLKFNDKSCDIGLPFLNIILKGQSWYNSLGFVYNGFDNDKKYNEEILNKSPDQFFSLMSNNEEQQIINSLINSLIEKLEIKKNDYKTIRDLFTELYNKSSSNCDYISIINDILFEIESSEVLKYERFGLFYDKKYDMKRQSTGGGASTRRRRKQKTKHRRSCDHNQHVKNGHIKNGYIKKGYEKSIKSTRRKSRISVSRK